VSLGVALVWWNGKVRFCEHGIVDRNRFIPWHECAPGRSDACYPIVIILMWGAYARAGRRPTKPQPNANQRPTPQSSRGGQIVVRVPPESREALECFLKEKL
jgi:hypothetical protein